MVYTYLLVVGLIVAFIDAFGIGANDNANNFANAVASKVVTPLQAVIIAAIFEFLGAVLVGNNVADAIRGRIINVRLFRSRPATLQLAMVCALMGSSTWLMLATRLGLPVSTTHSIIGAVLGVGVAAFGSESVNWEYGSGRGFAGIVASWFISIALSGLMAGMVFFIMRKLILRYKNSFQRSLVFGPIMFGITYGIVALSLVWKGMPKLKLDKISDNEVIGIVLGVFAASTVLTYLWVSIPLYRIHWLGEQWTYWDMLLGPFCPKRPVRDGFDTSHIAELAGKSIWYAELDEKYEAAEREIEEHNARVQAELEARKTQVKAAADPEAGVTDCSPRSSVSEGASDDAPHKPADEVEALKKQLAVYEAKVNTPRVVWFKQWKADYAAADWKGKAWLLARYVLLWGIDGRDVHGNTAERGHIAFAPKYHSKTEDMYVSLNVITSCIQSFSHGSNDVANAIGPLSTIYFVWENSAVPEKGAPVEVWQLAFGAAGIVLGLALYGYNIMRELGNSLTYQSPSRGYCMDLGSAITVLIASKEGFPISTTQAITGATVGVGIANGNLRAVNWKLMAKIVASWVFTLPFAGTLSGLIYAFVAFSPTQPHDPNSV